MGYNQDSTKNEDSLSEAEIVRVRNEGIARVVLRACVNSPFWAKHLADADISPQDILNAEDLKRIPPLYKDDLAEAGADLWCVDSREVVDVVTTSGTTGIPTLVPLTNNDIQRLGYNEFLSFACAGIAPSDTVLLAVTMDRCIMAGLAYYEGLRQTRATAVRVGSGSPAMLLRLIDRLAPSAIVSVPSFLKVVAKYALEQEIDLVDSSVTKLICIGEPVRNANLKLTPLASEIEADWGAKVFSTYGATEISGSLCECLAGQGGHLHPELLHIEILDECENAVKDGHIGQLVVTTLGVEAMPLIRFCTGDMTYMIPEKCSCGRKTPRIGPIVGRKNQMLKIKGMTVYPAMVQQTLEKFPQVREFAMIATSNHILSDHLEVVLVTNGQPEKIRQHIKKELQGELKVTPEVRVVSMEEILAIQCSATLRKKRVFIDRRYGRADDE